MVTAKYWSLAFFKLARVSTPILDKRISLLTFYAINFLTQFLTPTRSRNHTSLVCLINLYPLAKKVAEQSVQLIYCQQNYGVLYLLQ